MTKQAKNKVVLDKDYLEDLKNKASIFEEILSMVEDKYLGYLMKKTEKEKNVSLSQAKKLLR